MVLEPLVKRTAVNVQSPAADILFSLSFQFAAYLEKSKTSQLFRKQAAELLRHIGQCGPNFHAVGEPLTADLLA